MLSHVACAIYSSVIPNGLSKLNQPISLTTGIMRTCQGKKMPSRKKKYRPFKKRFCFMPRDSAKPIGGRISISPSRETTVMRMVLP